MPSVAKQGGLIRLDEFEGFQTARTPLLIQHEEILVAGPVKAGTGSVKECGFHRLRGSTVPSPRQSQQMLPGAQVAALVGSSPSPRHFGQTSIGEPRAFASRKRSFRSPITEQSYKNSEGRCYSPKRFGFHNAPQLLAELPDWQKGLSTLHTFNANSPP